MTEINFEDYLSESERKEIVAEVFRGKVIKEFNSERIFGNAAYDVVCKIVDEHFNGEMKELITKKAISLIDGLSTHHVFNKADAWERDSSLAWKHLQTVMSECKPQIQERVNVIISELDQHEIRENLKEYAVELLDNKLFGGHQ